MVIRDLLLSFVLLFLMSSPLSAETASAVVSENSNSAPSYSVYGGAGNAFGWLGVQVEKYVAKGHASVYAGLGHTIDRQESQGGICAAPDGATWAAGARLYTAGERHRAFLEASYTQVAVVWTCPSEIVKDKLRFYGPGLQVGYQRVAESGFTVQASMGVGFPLDSEADNSAEALLGIGFGYSW